ncbi:Gfo/Idh/MocA family oxidoreductase [Agriterribacter sp.]|uniref:Gfo/Idh/MocA family protein n=1 Tax=Agriterribacter sp. TaxID=2821509 RepID=UPI002CAD9B38|nr:Gfo/Idh/MocA family oxidoreductase [Agriterribacter sp.]HTN07376.1 Gfo/Idh/MocA family oxidoreductase [Agriterribacter sp.]
MRKLYSFALIGCGQISTRHAAQIKKHGIIGAVCDINRQKADHAAALYHSKAYYDIADMLQLEKEIDVSVVCTPNGLHAAHAIASLEHGMHVLCEKPMAIVVKDARDMLQAASANKKKLFIVKQNRYNPPVAELKKIMDENRLGDISSFQVNCFWNRPKSYYQNSWRGSKALDGGILFTQFSHFIDLLYWLLGDVKSINAIGRNYQHRDCIEFEDTAVVQLEMQSGAIGSLHFTINSFQSNMEGSITLFGEKGTIKIGGQYLNVLEYQRIKDYPVQELPQSKGANEYGSYTGSMSNHDKVYENLLNSLNGKAHDAVMAEDGIKTVEIIEQIYAGIRTHII